MMSSQKNDPIIELGQQCAVDICGDPVEARSVRTHATALAAIREALRLGGQRNDQRNELQCKYDGARVTIGFFASVIKSGEPWTEQCETHFRRVFPTVVVEEDERTDQR